MHVVYETLRELKVEDKKVVTLFNKIDKKSDTEHLRDSRADYTLRVSARRGDGLEEFKKILGQILSENQIYIERLFPYEKAGLIQLIRGKGQLLVEEYKEDGILVKARVPREIYGKVSD